VNIFITPLDALLTTLPKSARYEALKAIALPGSLVNESGIN